MKKNKQKSITEEVFKILGNIYDTFVEGADEFVGPPPPFHVEIEYLQKILDSDWTGRQIANVIYYFKNKDYLTQRKVKDQNKYFLSNKGVKKVLRLKAKKGISKKPKKFKDKYLIIIFDIPVQNKQKRSILRSILLELKFEKLQQSIWITKFDILQEVKTLIRFYKLEPYVKFMFVRKAEENI